MTYHAASDPQHTPIAYVNPGEGAVEAGDPLLAMLAAEHLILDAFDDPACWHVMRASRLDEAGRCGVALVHERPDLHPSGPFSGVIHVGIPALPVRELRYMQWPTQNAWHFPRLYLYDVGHDPKPGHYDSRLWFFALDQLRERFDRWPVR
jgi:hypothetical protein